MSRIIKTGKQPLLLLAIALSAAEVMADDTPTATWAKTAASDSDAAQLSASLPSRTEATDEVSSLSDASHSAVEMALEPRWALDYQPPRLIISSLQDLPATKLGSRGDGIYQLQEMLNQHGFQTPVNGIYDGQTYRQLVLFQGSKGLAAKGQVDTATIAALQGPYQLLPTPKQEPDISTQILKRGSRGVLVEQVQRLLVYQGFTLEIDGVFGLGTHRAIRQFQSSQGLQPDGIVGKKTARALQAMNPLWADSHSFALSAP